MSRSSTPPLGGLSADEFLERYWQKRPLLVHEVDRQDVMVSLPRDGGGIEI